MPTNDFLGFASAGSANIMSQADYAAAAEQTNGVQPGPASSKLANKIWRQGANMAAALGRIAAARGYDTLDNGDLDALQSSVDDTISVGTFSRMYFSQTSGSYTAPRTGVYRITLKGGGGGGGGATDSTHCIGSGGGEGGTLIFYIGLTKGQSYAYTIGAGGGGGANGSTYGYADITNGYGGGSTSFNNQYSVAGGERGLRQQTGGYGGAGGSTYTAPTGTVVFFIPGAHGENGHILPSSYTTQGGRGGGCSSFAAAGIYGSGGNGGGRGSLSSSSTGFIEPTAGGDGYILIEYAG